MSRPEILFPLFGSLERLPGVGPKIAKAFAGLRVEAPGDLLFTLPSGVIDRRPRASIREASLPAVVTVEAAVGRHAPPAGRGRPYIVTVHDAATSFQVVFFHAREEWVRRQLPSGTRRVLSGKVELYDGVGRMVHPDHIVPPEEADTIAAHEAVYSLAAGLTQRTVARAAAASLELAPDLAEWIDPALVAREGWLPWRQSLLAAHAPTEPRDCMPEHPVRRRLAYDELFAHQLTLALARKARRSSPGRSTVGTGVLSTKVLDALPYRPTEAQRRCLAEITADMAAPRRMNRLLQGDVGAGKTLVAFLALLAAVEAGGQGALMAPTEILARQHAAALVTLAHGAGVRLEVLTGRDAGPQRQDRLTALADGRIDILVGTHALFQEDVTFRDLRLAVVDEQHRFGVAQRMRLGAKGERTDVLVMTATPIPRSLALAQYGDMDVSVLDEKPPGRQPIKTVAVPGSRLDEVVDHLRRATAEGRRAYWVCPLVDNSESSDLTAASDRHARLVSALGGTRVGLVHGQMPRPERDAAMADFAAGRTGVLVATTVIEVGVDVPEATIMVIERAEWFGLAQLHQLRGRVGRGSESSTCILLYQPPLTEGGRRRLETLRETEDGFRIAEQDLTIRGIGDLIGTAQSGLPQFRVADAERQSGLMATAQKDARRLIDSDPDLTGPRGRAARTLLWLMRQDRAIRLLDVG